MLNAEFFERHKKVLRPAKWQIAVIVFVAVCAAITATWTVAAVVYSRPQGTIANDTAGRRLQPEQRARLMDHIKELQAWPRPLWVWADPVGDSRPFAESIIKFFQDNNVEVHHLQLGNCVMQQHGGVLVSPREGGSRAAIDKFTAILASAGLRPRAASYGWGDPSTSGGENLDFALIICPEKKS